MAYEITNREHRLTLEQREHLVISGVEEVERFDEESIVLTTNMGELEIRGRGCTLKSCRWRGANSMWRAPSPP